MSFKVTHPTDLTYVKRMDLQLGRSSLLLRFTNGAPMVDFLLAADYFVIGDVNRQSFNTYNSLLHK